MLLLIQNAKLRDSFLLCILLWNKNLSLSRVGSKSLLLFIFFVYYIYHNKHLLRYKKTDPFHRLCNNNNVSTAGSVSDHGNNLLLTSQSTKSYMNMKLKNKGHQFTKPHNFLASHWHRLAAQWMPQPRQMRNTQYQKPR